MADELKQQASAAAEADASVSLLDQLVESARIKPGDDAYSITRQGIQAFVSQLLEPQRAVERITQGLVDEMIANLDKKLGAQMDEILHNDDFQKLESAWRSLKFLIDRTDFRENVKIEILNVSKQDLLDDFEDAPKSPSPACTSTSTPPSTASSAASRSAR